MRRINKDYEISSNVIRPFKTGTHQHLENAVQELGHMLVKMIKTDAVDADGTVQILYGCENTGSGSNYIISAGAIMYKDPDMDEPEFFFVAAANITVSGGNVAAAVIITTSYTGNVNQGDIADPVLMSDNASKDVHDIRTIQIIDGSSGSPGFIAAFDDFNPVAVLPTYTNIAPVSPFANTGGAHAPLGYIKTAERFVKLRGRVTHTPGGDNTYETICTLPSGFRPAYTQTFVTEYSCAGGVSTSLNSHQFSIQILTTGEVQLINYSHFEGALDISLDAIEFPTF